MQVKLRLKGEILTAETEKISFFGMIFFQFVILPVIGIFFDSGYIV